MAELRSGVDEDTDPQDLSPQQVARLHQLLQEARFRDPDGGHLSPAGEYNLRLGILKEIQPDMVATWQGALLAPVDLGYLCGFNTLLVPVPYG